MFIYKDLRNTIDERMDTKITLEPIFRDVGDGRIERVAESFNIHYALDYSETIRIKLKIGQSVYTDAFHYVLTGEVFNHLDMGDYWTIPEIVHKKHFFDYFNNLDLTQYENELGPDFMDREAKKFHNRDFRINFVERLTDLYPPLEENDHVYYNMELGRDPNKVSKLPLGTYKVEITNERNETSSCVVDFEDAEVTLEFEPMGKNVYILIFKLLKSKNKELTEILTNNHIRQDVFDEGKDRISMAITPSSRWSNHELFQVFKTNIAREIFSNI